MDKLREAALELRKAVADDFSNAYTDERKADLALKCRLLAINYLAENDSPRGTLAELVAAMTEPYPPYEAGSAAQNAWAERQFEAITAARTILEETEN